MVTAHSAPRPKLPLRFVTATPSHVCADVTTHTCVFGAPHTERPPPLFSCCSLVCCSAPSALPQSSPKYVSAPLPLPTARALMRVPCTGLVGGHPVSGDCWYRLHSWLVSHGTSHSRLLGGSPHCLLHALIPPCPSVRVRVRATRMRTGDYRARVYGPQRLLIRYDSIVRHLNRQQTLLLLHRTSDHMENASFFLKNICSCSGQRSCSRARCCWRCACTCSGTRSGTHTAHRSEATLHRCTHSFDGRQLIQRSESAALLARLQNALTRHIANAYIHSGCERQLRRAQAQVKGGEYREWI
jgi:hypothetical protein